MLKLIKLRILNISREYWDQLILHVTINILFRLIQQNYS
jgi:hypothetical protein